MKFYKTDWFLRIASLVAAIVIWFYVVYQENPMFSQWIPNIAIAQENLSQDFENGKLVIMSISTDDADVKVSGRRRIVSSIDAASAQASVDMSKVTEAGTYNLPINVNFATDGVDVAQIRPNYCTVVVDRVVTEEREIEVTTKGSVAAEHALDDITINPSVIKLTGPQMSLSTVSSCSISVDLTNATEDIKGLYKIKLYDERGQEITNTSIIKNIEYTDMYCSVSAAKEIKVIPSLSGEVNSNGQRVTAICEPETIMVKGKTATLDNIEEVYTEMIDITEIYESTQVEQRVLLPNGLFYFDENTTVNVKLSITE